MYIYVYIYICIYIYIHYRAGVVIISFTDRVWASKAIEAWKDKGNLGRCLLVRDMCCVHVHGEAIEACIYIYIYIYICVCVCVCVRVRVCVFEV